MEDRSRSDPVDLKRLDRMVLACAFSSHTNLLNSKSDQIGYAYGSLIKSDSLFTMCFPHQGAPTAPAAVCQTGVMDRVLHPVEPPAVRLTLAGPF